MDIHTQKYKIKLKSIQFVFIIQHNNPYNMYVVSCILFNIYSVHT